MDSYYLGSGVNDPYGQPVYQMVLGADGNPETPDAPHIINNSWTFLYLAATLSLNWIYNPSRLPVFSRYLQPEMVAQILIPVIARPIILPPLQSALQTTTI
jgi:hypothetical protein